MTELELTEKTCQDRLREAEAMGRKLVDHVDLLQRKGLYYLMHVTVAEPTDIRLVLCSLSPIASTNRQP